MSKVFSPLAIDYSAGTTIKDGQVIPNKIGCEVEDLETAREFAKRWKG